MGELVGRKAKQAGMRDVGERGSLYVQRISIAHW